MKNIKPTESELEILNVIWEKGAATVREVHEVLEKLKPSGYTTTLKLMQIMYEKNLLQREASGKTHIYKAAMGKEAVQGQIVQRMIDNVFSGSAARLVMQALGNNSTSAEELDEIRKYLKSL